MDLHSKTAFPLLLILLLGSTPFTICDSTTRPNPMDRAEPPKFAPGPNGLDLWNEFDDVSTGQDNDTALLFLPTLVVADVPVYNLPGPHERLRFTSDALAGIFRGTIKRWNDPLITTANPGIHLPNRQIVVICRTDENGETLMWTDYLSKVSQEWNRTVGKGATVPWPVGVGVNGREELQKELRKTPYSLAYMERSSAVQEKLQFGDVQNSQGQFVRADALSVSAAATGTTLPDFKSFISITNSPGAGTYPIAGFSGFIIPEHISDARKKASLVSFLRWVLTEGQKIAVKDGYIPVPASIVHSELQLLDVLSQ